MQKKAKKLALARETVKALDPDFVVEVGGASHPASRCVTCCGGGISCAPAPSQRAVCTIG